MRKMTSKFPVQKSLDFSYLDNLILPFTWFFKKFFHSAKSSGLICNLFSFPKTFFPSCANKYSLVGGIFSPFQLPANQTSFFCCTSLASQACFVPSMNRQSFHNTELTLRTSMEGGHTRSYSTS